MTLDIANLNIANEYSRGDQIKVGNDQGLPISHYDNSVYFTPYKNFLFKDILLIPKITKSFLLVQKFVTTKHCFFNFSLLIS